MSVNTLHKGDDDYGDDDDNNNNNNNTSFTHSLSFGLFLETIFQKFNYCSGALFPYLLGAEISQLPR